MNVQKLRIAWVGFHMEGIPALRALLEKGIHVAAVFTLDEEASAKRSAAVPYDDICARYGVPLHKIRHINDPASVDLLNKLDLDVVFVIGWSQIVGGEALRSARLGMVGAHASFLPHNRGSAPVNWALIRGETTAGNTLIWLEEQLDAGQIIDQVSFPITPYDTCASLYEKVAESNREMILRLVPRLLAGERPGRAQPHTDEPILPRRRPEDGLIDWHKPAPEVYNFIRALTRPYPGAFSWLDGRRYRVWDAVLLPDEVYPGAEPGRVLGAACHMYPAHASGQVVACGRGAVILVDLESDDGIVWQGRDLSEQSLLGKVWSNG